MKKWGGMDIMKIGAQLFTIRNFTQTEKDFVFDEKLVSVVSVIRIDVAEYTAKYRPMPQK